MSDAELTVDDKPLSPIQIFCTKVVVVTAAALVMFYFADAVIESSIRSQAESLQILQGGPAFWKNAERKLFLLADDPWVRLVVLDKCEKSSMPFENSRLNTNHISTH